MSAWRETLQHLFDVQGGRCYYCGEQTVMDGNGLSTGVRQAQIEHTKPRWRGAKKREGLVMSCHSCNYQKGRLDIEEYRLWKGLRTGNLPYRFALEAPGPVDRDVLVIVSPRFVGGLVRHNESGA
jgi:5-methylcytosine-specific restriction endonuclease McrA